MTEKKQFFNELFVELSKIFVRIHKDNYNNRIFTPSMDAWQMKFTYFSQTAKRFCSQQKSNFKCSFEKKHFSE